MGIRDANVCMMILSLLGILGNISAAVNYAGMMNLGDGMQLYAIINIHSYALCSLLIARYAYGCYTYHSLAEPKPDEAKKALV
jgi:hypothetical protein